MTVTPRQSLTVVVSVTDGLACAAALLEHKTALETALTETAGVESASLALLPPQSKTEPYALFFECSFFGRLPALLGALFARAEAAAGAVFGHCSGFPEPPTAEAFATYLSAHARRSRASPSATCVDSSFWRRLRRALAARCYWPASVEPTDADELERRRGAVGMQDFQPGAPLLHVARVRARSLARLKRALRVLEEEPVLDPGARFVLYGERLLFFAYPQPIAALWSEQVSRAALPVLTQIWACSTQFAARPWRSRARRARELQRFLLDGRAPVSVWFNVSARRFCAQ